MSGPESPKQTLQEERSEKDAEQTASSSRGSTISNDIDLLSYHEKFAGRLVVDPQEAKAEFGEVVASRLKLSEDGTKVLWPQPTDSPNDPQNWSAGRKSWYLFIITLAAIVPDFDSAIGIPAIFALANEYNTTSGVINNVTSNWSVFLLGWGGLAAVMIVRRFGRLPVLFWSQVINLGFLIGCALAPNLKTFAAMRCLTAFFGTVPQVTGLYVVTDMYPFHLQAQKLNIWTMGFIISPFLSPFFLGFLIAREDWRWAYATGCFYSFVVVLLLAFFMEETLYDRTLKPIPEPTSSGLRYRIETLVGITGWRLSKLRTPWKEAILSPLNVVWRPQILGVLIYEGILFGLGAIGVNVTIVVFLGSPPPLGFGKSEITIAGIYATPIVSVLLGEVFGRYVNDWLMYRNIKRNNGVFEAESRLWACYIALPLFICAFVLLGAALEKHLSIAAIVMGWGIAEFAVMITTVAIYAYCNDCFPKHQGEVSALINLARILGGFSVAYFQIPWASSRGAIQTFGVEAAIVAGLFLLVIPIVQFKGKYLREKYSL